MFMSCMLDAWNDDCGCWIEVSERKSRSIDGSSKRYALGLFYSKHGQWVSHANVAREQT